MISSSSTLSFSWLAEGRAFEVVFQTFGSGPQVLFLPAISTVSTRLEWQAVAAELASQFTVTLVDWPGFGASSRPRATYSPALFEAFLRDFARARFGKPVAVAAAGHAAGYVLRTAGGGEALWSRAVLVAPTWRGPLPTAMGLHPKLYALLHRLVRTPGLGHALYWVSTSRWFLRRMLGRHVFANQNGIDSRLVKEKQRLARQRGARFAAAAFVTGALDPFSERSSCVDAVQRTPFPVLLIVGRDTPPKSGAEMAALTSAGSPRSLVLPGSLGLHEEQARDIVAPLCQFLAQPPVQPLMAS